MMMMTVAPLSVTLTLIFEGLLSQRRLPTIELLSHLSWMTNPAQIVHTLHSKSVQRYSLNCQNMFVAKGNLVN